MSVNSHNDHHGNSIHFFDLNTMSFKNLTAAVDVSCVTSAGARITGVTGTMCRCETPTYSWLSTHTYAGVNYVEGQDALVLIAGAHNEQAGGFTKKNAMLKIETKEWVALPELQYANYAVSCYDKSETILVSERESICFVLMFLCF